MPVMIYTHMALRSEAFRSGHLPPDTEFHCEQRHCRYHDPMAGCLAGLAAHYIPDQLAEMQLGSGQCELQLGDPDIIQQLKET